MKKTALLFIVFIVSIVLLIGQIEKRELLKRSGEELDSGISVILTGFGSEDDKGNWTGEAAQFFMKAEELQDVGDSIRMCQKAYEGKLYGNKVLIVSSGMAKVRTTACLSDIFQYYGKRVNEVIVVGIAGMTPMKGGLLDNEGNVRSSEKVMLGDVCINSISYDFDMQHYTSDQAGTKLPNPVYWPEDDSFTSSYTKGNNDLANELYNASLKIDWSETPQKVKDMNVFYHKSTRQPKSWGPTECLEVTSDQYWHDTRADERAREIAAGYINSEFGSNLNASDVLVATSMESLPAGVYVDWWNKNNNSKVAFAYVRGASNFDQASVNEDSTPAEGGRESLMRFDGSGASEYAIETSSLPVLKMFESRSIKNQ